MPTSARAGILQLCPITLLLLVAAPTALPAQERCSSTEDPGGEEWESIVSRRAALDSIHGGVVERTGGDDGSGPAGVIAAHADTASGRTEVVVEARGMSQTTRDGLVGRFVEHLQTRPLEPDESVVLDLRLGVEADIPRREAAVERCLPTLTNRDEVASELEEAARRILDFMEEAGDDARDVRREILLDVVLSRTGEVEDVAIATPSGNPYLNVQARKVGRSMRYEPATLNGVPVAMWIQQPVHFALPRPD